MSTRLDLPTAKLAAAYEAGATLQDLADAHGCSLSSVSTRLRQHGVTMRPTGTRPDKPSMHARITLAVSEEKRDAVYAAAAEAGVSVSEYVRGLLGWEV